MILRRAFGVVLAGLVVCAGPASAQTTAPSSPSAPVTLDSVGIPSWIWVLVSIAGLLAVIVVGVRQLRGRRKD
ncbi:hypothetical protein Q5425_29695 [Amycolatopsis sp. A133]|uniref:hypothetical protein n=1 Tax=Amycolatopsis sp. A133 TaxID=3064472 RepID=UPI0027EE0424|nr:hypothetical protein [Amycolatopsis sp. A133]MDQ7807931.1 hypothetical protein [Amycolatopsis sp. A133]